MSTVTLQQIGQDLAGWLAAVQRGEIVAIVDAGREVARIVPPEEKPPAASGAKLEGWAAERMKKLEEIFPEPVAGASDELEEFRADRF